MYSSHDWIVFFNSNLPIAQLFGKLVFKRGFCTKILIELEKSYEEEIYISFTKLPNIWEDLRLHS